VFLDYQALKEVMVKEDQEEEKVIKVQMETRVSLDWTVYLEPMVTKAHEVLLAKGE
jgi:hypothetical protein